MLIESKSEPALATDPWTLYLYAMRSPATKEKYIMRLGKFLSYLNLQGTIENKRFFAHKGNYDNVWAFNNIIEFLHIQKERFSRKEIAAGTIRNYVKSIKLFCQMTDVSIPWEKITRGLPKGRRYAEDRTPPLEEIRKLCDYPDRRIRPLIYTMVSSAIRVGASDYLHWGNIRPIEQGGKIVAARMLVYAAEED
jgi:hypothetical protein